jgi:RHS repeat-associated protein
VEVRLHSGIQGGQVGLRLDNAHTHFQEVALRQFVNVTQYYYLGGQRVALRRDGGLTYLLADHLGSTALTVDSSGAKVAELRYKAYGETRFASGTTPTDYRYTGQREEALLGGLVHMGARFYDVSLARWLSADTLVPEPGNPQALNRYSYVVGRVLNLTDPTGHYYYDPGCDCLVKTHENRLEYEEYTRRPTAEEMTNPFGAIMVQEMLIPEGEGAIGLRLDVSVASIGYGADLNVELLYKPGEGFGLYVSPSVGYATPGWGVTAGPVFVTNLPSLDEYSGHVETIGGSLKLVLGLEVDVSGDPDDPEAPRATYFGVGPGIEWSGYAMTGETRTLSGWWDELKEWLGLDE